MSDDTLTPAEKGVLLAHIDARSDDDYDPKFFQMLVSQDLPSVDQLKDRTRRAITLFMTLYLRDIKLPAGDDEALSEENILAAMTCCYFIGYEMGRKLRSPLTRK